MLQSSRLEGEVVECSLCSTFSNIDDLSRAHRTSARADDDEIRKSRKHSNQRKLFARRMSDEMMGTVSRSMLSRYHQRVRADFSGDGWVRRECWEKILIRISPQPTNQHRFGHSLRVLRPHTIHHLLNGPSRRMVKEKNEESKFVLSTPPVVEIEQNRDGSYSSSVA